jgi:hypothetical protein
MAWRITCFEDTPNPDALKCLLDRPISDGPVSFRRPEDADAPDADPSLAPLARLLFAEAGLTGVLFLGDWMAINKPPAARWASVRRAVSRVLADPPRPAPLPDTPSNLPPASSP